MLRRPGWPLILLFALCGACDPTELVLIARSDLPGDRIALVDVVVTSATRAVQHRCVCVAPPCAAATDATASWPLTAGLRPGRGDDGEVVVELRGLPPGDCAGTPIIRQRARTRFVAHARRALRMSLTARCLDVSCTSEDETCRDGACVPVEFPTEPFDGTPPDLAASDLAPPVPEVVSSGGAGSLGQPVIARNSAAYVIQAAGTGGMFSSRAYDLTGAAAGSFTTFVPGLGGARPALAVDNDNFVVTLLTGSAPVFMVIDGQTTMVQVFETLPTGNFNKVAITSDGTSVRIALGEPDGIRRLVRARDVGPFAYQAPETDPNMVGLTGIPPGLFVAGDPTTTTSVTAVSLDATSGFRLVSAGMSLPTTHVNGAQYAGDRLGLAMVPGARAALLVSETLPTHELQWATFDVPTAMPFAYASITPPLIALPLEIVVAFDPPGVVLAYTTGQGIVEHECFLATRDLSCSPARTIADDASAAVDGLAYAPGPMHGGGRYAWRAQTPTGTEIRTVRRSATLP